MMQGDVLVRSEHILVVEDDEFSQQLIELYLRKAGFSELTVAADGRQALDLAKERTFDLVLLDLNLPRIGGAEVLRRLKKEGFLTDTPVIVISSIANMEDIVHCMDLGAEDYLPKPFNVRLLEGRVSACLEKRRLKAAARGALERRERDHQAARRLQAALSGPALPSTLPSAGDRPGVAVAAAMIAAAEPGGDFQNSFPLPGGSALMAVGTVAGHGVTATLALARLYAELRRAVDRILAEGGPVEPHALLAWVNRELCGSGTASPAAFPAATLLVGVLAPADGTLRLASAGHPDPVLLSPGGGLRPVICRHGRPLGLQADATYADVEQSLAEDDVLLLFSKGLLDAADATGAPFGWQRAAAALDGCDAAGPEQVVSALEGQVRRFVGRAAQRDDVTIVALRLERVDGEQGGRAGTGRPESA